MKLKHWLIAFVLLDFIALSGYAVHQLGYLGIWQAGLSDIGSLQILLDLVIACVVAMGWMIKDAREKGLTVWPYLLATIFTGSIGLLLYLLLRDRHRHPKNALAG